MTARRLLGPRAATWLLALLALAGCTRQAPEHHHRFLGFGTLVEVTVYDTDAETAARAFAVLEEDFALMHATWHAWEPGALGRVNQNLSTGGEFTVNPVIRPLIVEGAELSRRSRGLFNPAIGKLIALWGFQSDERGDAPPPSPEAVAELLAEHPSMDDLVLDGLTLHSTNPAVRLDFGAFAKGRGVDMGIERLRELGIANAIINAGGDLRAIGRHGKRPWRIGVRHPRGEGLLAALEVEGDQSVFTSGDYERYFEFDGRRYHHILDPRTGFPAQGSTSVTVIHREAAIADAAATALFVAGPQDWPLIARDMGVDQVMLVDTDGVVHMTPAMAERVRFEVEPRPEVRVTPLP